jgi:aminopeptidase N
MQSKFSDNFRGTLYAPKDLFGETVYDKGAWVLHMLRYEIGDSSFFKSLHNYYDLYKYSNASVEDFKTVCENVSGNNLDKFFDQWIYSGTDNIFCSYTFTFADEDRKECVINIYQEPQTYEEFHFPLEIKFDFIDGSSKIQKVYIDEKEVEFTFKFDLEIQSIHLDPDSRLLGTFEKSYSR